jgi:putative endonuclease
MNKWYQYVARCSDGSYYAGVTTDPARRLHEHNATKKGAKYTRSRRPIQLVYCTEYLDRSSAQKAEAVFKKLSRREKEKIVSENLLMLL